MPGITPDTRVRRGRRVGVMGGTFDPIHNGHLVAASEVADRFHLDEVIFVPTGRPWQKFKADAGVSPPEDRYLMTVIATAANPRFSVSRVDIDREGDTYTVDTLRDLHTLNPDAQLFFITGADALASILSWQDWEALFELASFVGVSRPGYELGAAHLERHLKKLPPDTLHLMEIPALAISSTDCRERAAGGRPVSYLVPDGVVQYISKRKLYRSKGHSVTASPEAVSMATVAAHAAVDKLASNVVVIDVSEQLVITDCFVIASADNERQVASIVDEIEEKLREAGNKPVRREGTREGRWTLLDYIDVVVHVLHEEEREFYALERLWKDCPLIDIPGIESKLPNRFNEDHGLDPELGKDLGE